MTVASAPGPLTSWTRTLNEDDALMLLQDARPAEAVEDWIERAHQTLPQPSRARRQETIRMVRRSLLDVDETTGCIADSRYLQLIREGRPRLRFDLLYGRYLYANGWIDRALTELVHPAIEAAEEPLSPPEAALIITEAWAAFVSRHVKPGSGKQSIQKTRSRVVTNLTHLGVLEPASEPTRVRRGQPEHLAFGWLLSYEMSTRGVGEWAEHLAAAQSRATRLFAPSPAYAEQCIAQSIGAGLLRQGHLVGQARLFPGAL